MVQIIFATLLISLIILPIPLLMIAHNKQKRKELKALLKEFSRTGTQNELAFSSQEVLRNSVIGLDGLQRKLLLVERKEKDMYQSVVIDLNEIKGCTVDKKYRSISRGDSSKPEQILETISLKFDVPQLSVPDVVFFSNAEENVHNAPEMEGKAKDWQMMLTKLQTPALKIA